MPIQLSDLPPKYREQALKQLAQYRKRESPASVTAKLVAEQVGMEFDSRGEYEFWLSVILPKVRNGEIVRYHGHPRFDLFPPGEYCGIKLSAVRYTADFRLDYADGSVEIVEVKSKFVRKMQCLAPKMTVRTALPKYCCP